MTMVSRLIGLLLGLMLAAAGYIIVQPLGSLVPPPPPVSLGEFEGLRVLIGWGALALGGMAILANLWPARPKSRPPSVRDRVWPRSPSRTTRPRPRSTARPSRRP